MKKFIRSKMDDIEIRNRVVPDPPQASDINLTDPVTSEVQPPLPLEPPPPDENNTLHVKQEVPDDEYESSPSEDIPIIQQNLEPLTNSENITAVDPGTAEVPICRDYVRGTCNRPGTCKYAHKFDLNHLVGVYTFCRNYQTSVCTFPNCKYVHATVFEEHHFYRTAILPPHVLAHHKEVNQMQPPPPPPPPPPKKYSINISKNTNMSMNLTLAQPPPPLQNEIFQGDLGNTVPLRNDTLKRQWNNIEQFSSSPSDRDTNEPFTKKCKHCDILEFRLHYNKDKVEQMLLAKETLIKKMFILEMKSEKLSTLISALLTLPSQTPGHNDGLGSLGDDKDKTLLEQLKSIVTVTNSLAALEEEE